MDNFRNFPGFLRFFVHRHPRTWYGEVEILFDLLQSFGEDWLYEAMRTAVERRLYGAHYVVSMLRGVA